MDGKLVKLACDGGDPSQLVDDDGKPKTQPLRLKLADAKYQPYANKEFVVKAGGARVEGMTGGDGSIDVPVPIEAQTAEVTVWLKKRPTGPMRRYVVELKQLDPADTVIGAQQRLRHLGYYHRSPDGQLDAPTTHALEDFQNDHSRDGAGGVCRRGRCGVGAGLRCTGPLSPGARRWRRRTGRRAAAGEGDGREAGKRNASEGAQDPHDWLLLINPL